MFINQNFIAIIFRLINFIALIGIVFFVFKKYLKKNILLNIEKKEADYHHLLAQQTHLDNEQKELDVLIKKERVQIQDFHTKIDEWKKVVVTQNYQQEQAYNAFLTTIEKRNRAIAVIKENTHTQNKIIDIVAADLENSLSQHFKDNQKNAAYMAEIIHFMSKRIS